MPTSKKSKTQKSSAIVPTPIPGTLSIQGPIPVTGAVSIERNRWEYFVREVGPQGIPIAELRALLRDRGNEGFELLGGLFNSPGIPLIFKRPI
jgi:hypothetical protein